MTNYYLSSLLDILFPRKCVVCDTLLGVGESHLCHGCLEDMPLTYYWNWRENPAEKRLWARTYIERVIPLFFYSHDNNYKNLIRRIKYHGDKKLGLFLGRMLGEYIADGERYDYIVPVPLHWRKMFKRGYNQAEVIASGIVTGMAVTESAPVLDSKGLKRARYTETQTKIKTGSKWDNVAGAFMVSSPERYIGKHILLVDDVLTSGATIEACYNALSGIENIKVSVATLGYVE